MGSFVVKALDHIVLTVRSIPATVEFYSKNLGMRHETFRSPKDVSVER
jgi:catechol 2,3-dioxygenase-like lactoylglutathione lyase family enzyme